MRQVLQEWLVCLFTGQPGLKPNCKWKFIVSLIMRSKNAHKQPFKCTYLITRIRCPMLLSYCRFPALRSPFWQVLKIRFITHSEEDKGSSAAQYSSVHCPKKKLQKTPSCQSARSKSLLYSYSSNTLLPKKFSMIKPWPQEHGKYDKKVST